MTKVCNLLEKDNRSNGYCLLCRLALFRRIQNYAEDREQLSPVEGNPIPSYHIVPAIL